MNDFAGNPIERFDEWFQAALGGGLVEPSAMTIATVSADGRPAARMVLLKHFDDDGFVFCTGYRSRKGEELGAVPWAALVFWWDRLHRQVRVEGPVERVSAQESDRYWRNRPRGSQLGARASAQSEVIASRGVLEARLHEENRLFAGEPVPRPEHWGGYRVRCDVIEFWEGREDRLHDRMRYTRTGDGGWRVERLSP